MIKRTIEFVPTGTTGATITAYNFNILLTVQSFDLGFFDPIITPTNIYGIYGYNLDIPIGFDNLL